MLVMMMLLIALQLSVGKVSELELEREGEYLRKLNRSVAKDNCCPDTTPSR